MSDTTLIVDWVNRLTTNLLSEDRPRNMKLVVPTILASLKTLTNLSLQPRRYHRLTISNLNRIMSSISRVLQSMAGENVITVLKIEFNFIKPTPWWRRDVWHKFEDILLGPGWQLLTQFGLKINFSYIGGDSDLVEGIRRLPETYIPGLLSSSSVELIFGIQ